jgi:hypothetical protein
MTTEKNWKDIFAYDLPNPAKPKPTKCTCGGKNCQTAKHIKCVCRCHSEFHGIANRAGMEPLDKVLGLETEQSIVSADMIALETEPPRLIPWLEVC